MSERDYAGHDLAPAQGSPSVELSRSNSATVSDALGLAGGGADSYMHAPSRLTGRAGAAVSGRAITLCFEPARPGARSTEAPYLAIDVIARCRPGDVLVMATGGARTAFWGEHMVGQALAAGLEGAVLDGPIRDLHAIGRTGFPIFATDTSPQTYLGRYEAVAYNEPVVVDGAAVSPGDFVIADDDGVVVVPSDLVAVVERGVRTIAELEEKADREIAAGADPREVQREIGWSFVSLSDPDA